jgi:predicted Rossmann fold flavoprotein
MCSYLRDTTLGSVVPKCRVIVVGGGAAGFFAAIACAESSPQVDVTILEKTDRFLGKVRISGGGRCNVTNGRLDMSVLGANYPRGARALHRPYQVFAMEETVAWFAARGVKLKTEPDGRMFPVTDSSQTIIDCLATAAANCGVKLRASAEIAHAECLAEGGFRLTDVRGQIMTCDRLLLATGGCRSAVGANLPVSFGHSIEPLAPSLFSFHVDAEWVRGLAGVSVASVGVSIAEGGLRERGPILLTHWGVSGPAILRLSAWGARSLQTLNYKFLLRVNWLPEMGVEQIDAILRSRASSNAARFVVKDSIAPLPARLWENLVLTSGVAPDVRNSNLSSAARHALIQRLIRCELPVTGKSLNKDEFVTCGGVRLQEVDFHTMESRLRPGLYFAGELLDIDGITGGYNFQAAWTTGWIAGKAMAT